MATKFSAFTLENNPQNLTTQLVGLDTVLGTNIKVPADFALLDALCDSQNQVNNDMLYINGGNVDLINPSQHPNIPVRAVLYASYQPGAGNVNYFNFTNGADVNVPFNSATTNISTDSVAGAYTFTWNGLAGSSGNTNWNVPITGLYRATVNMHFFDQANGIIVEGFIRNITAGSVDSGLIDDVGNAASGAKTDINYSATGVFSATANDAIEFRIKFTGGSGSPSPFPSVDNNLVTNICIEYIN